MSNYAKGNWKSPPLTMARNIETQDDTLELLRAKIANLRARCDKAETIAAAARNLIAQKGRHNTEIAYKRLENAIAKERAS